MPLKFTFLCPFTLVASTNYARADFVPALLEVNKGIREDMNRIPEKLINMGCKVKKKQRLTDYLCFLPLHPIFHNFSGIRFMSRKTFVEF
jgi:hypothetical protein